MWPLPGLENWADDYTFQEVKVDSKYHVRWEEILEYLSLSCGSRFFTTVHVCPAPRRRPRRQTSLRRACTGGGILTVTVEAIAPQGGYSGGEGEVMDQNNRRRVLDFVILQEVGQPLQLYKYSRELTSVIFQGIRCTL